jgi:hypothetical protein
MAGTAVNYTVAEIIRGPVNIFLDVAAPAAGAEVTIDSTGNLHTPDATANPSATALGLFTGGMEVRIGQTFEHAEADQLTSPYRSAIASDEVVLSPKGVLPFAGTTGANRYITTPKLLQGATASTPTGKRKITGGGLTTITYRTVLAIWADPSDETDYEYILLYRAFNDAGLAFTLSRKTDAASDLAFRGFADASRTAGDQVYQWVHKT